MEDKHNTLPPDDDYRKDIGCGCVFTFVVVIIFFATIAGLWLFLN